MHARDLLIVLFGLKNKSLDIYREFLMITAIAVFVLAEKLRYPPTFSTVHKNRAISKPMIVLPYILLCNNQSIRFTCKIKVTGSLYIV